MIGQQRKEKLHDLLTTNKEAVKIFDLICEIADKNKPNPIDLFIACLNVCAMLKKELEEIEIKENRNDIH
jgi:hypothetical protein